MSDSSRGDTRTGTLVAATSPLSAFGSRSVLITPPPVLISIPTDIKTRIKSRSAGCSCRRGASRRRRRRSACVCTRTPFGYPFQEAFQLQVSGLLWPTSGCEHLGDGTFGARGPRPNWQIIPIADHRAADDVGPGGSGWAALDDPRFLPPRRPLRRLGPGVVTRDSWRAPARRGGQPSLGARTAPSRRGNAERRRSRRTGSPGQGGRCVTG